MPEVKKKRTVKCGKCQAVGHNARTCAKRKAAQAPVGASLDTAVAVAEPVGVSASQDEEEPPSRQRSAPTAPTGVQASASPHRCPKCHSVAILTIVDLGGDRSEMRCIDCINKPQPPKVILKWGASPGDKIT